MTSEAPDEPEATSGASEEPSGASASEASGGSSDPRSDGERSDPRGSREPDESADDAGDEIPLNIAGHEDREPPGEEDDLPDGDDTADADAEDGTAAADDAAATGEPGDATGPDESDDGAATEIPTGEPTVDDPFPDQVPGVSAADAESDDEDEEVEPIELLVQLAKDGEIDPWDVDVVAVTEEFLDALEYGDLRQSGRALFYASVLVRMKSDVLLEDPEEEPEQEEPWNAPMEAPEDAPPAFDPVDSLEDEMERRLQRQHVRGTPETLDELVRELREAERDSWWKESREYDTSGSPSGFDRGTQTVDYHADDARRRDGEPTAGEVTERTHGADIEEVIDDVRASIQEHYEAGRPEVLFREVEDAGGSRVLTFLAVLFLANRGEVRLQQDDLFGDLWLQDPTADLGAESALAD